MVRENQADGSCPALDRYVDEQFLKGLRAKRAPTDLIFEDLNVAFPPDVVERLGLK